MLCYCFGGITSGVSDSFSESYLHTVFLSWLLQKNKVSRRSLAYISSMLLLVLRSHTKLIMDVEEWSGSSDSEVTSPDSENEDLCYDYGDLPKLQFRFLSEIGALHLLDDEDKLIPLEDIYKKVAEGVGGSCWESFEVYRHLKSLGYIIKRHGICWSVKRAKIVAESVEGESGSQRITESGNVDGGSITEITELFSTLQIKEVRPVFDVYPPNSKFRKSSPGNPMFVLCINTKITVYN